jgi:hypothetical protein
MAKRSLTASLVALLFAAGMLAVAALTADAATIVQELGFGMSIDGQVGCPTNVDPNQVCETHSVSGQVFGSPIRHGTFTGTMILGAVTSGPPQPPSCGPFTGTVLLGTVDPGPSNIQSLLALTLSGIHCVGPGGGCIEAGTFTIDGAASTGQFQGASGQGRFGALIGPNGEVVLGLRTR